MLRGSERILLTIMVLSHYPANRAKRCITRIQKPAVSRVIWSFRSNSSLAYLLLIILSESGILIVNCAAQVNCCHPTSSFCYRSPANTQVKMIRALDILFSLLGMICVKQSEGHQLLQSVKPAHPITACKDWQPWRQPTSPGNLSIEWSPDTVRRENDAHRASGISRISKERAMNRLESRRSFKKLIYGHSGMSLLLLRLIFLDTNNYIDQDP